MELGFLIAPTSFKECAAAEDVADWIERGVKSAIPSAKIYKVPLADGGIGFTKHLLSATPGELKTVTVTGPLGNPVESNIGFMRLDGEETAVFEIAAAAGLALVPRPLRNPLFTTTVGVGELILKALDAGARKILVGCGDSGTCDGGAGMAQALGARLLDEDGLEISPGGGELLRLRRIDTSRLDPRLGNVTIEVACNCHCMLSGPKGVARVFGPQKGASPELVEWLSEALDHYSDIVERDLGVDIRAIRGSGASGGLAGGLKSFAGAHLRPFYEIAWKHIDIESYLNKVDIVITAEGSLDEQTPLGKVPFEVARSAKRLGLPVLAVAGVLGDGADLNYSYGIDAFCSIQEGISTFDNSVQLAPELVPRATARLLRAVLVGRDLFGRKPSP